MFERFTQAARRAVVLAQEEAREEGSPTLGVLHLLHGVLSDTDGAPALVLKQWGIDAARVASLSDAATSFDGEALSAAGIDLEEVRRRAEEQFGSGALDEPRDRKDRRRPSGHIPLTPGAKAALSQAVQAAAFHRDHEIGSAQLFLGLLTDGSVVRILSRLGVNVSTEALVRLVRQQIERAA